MSERPKGMTLETTPGPHLGDGLLVARSIGKIDMTTWPPSHLPKQGTAWLHPRNHGQWRTMQPTSSQPETIQGARATHRNKMGGWFKWYECSTQVDRGVGASGLHYLEPQSQWGWVDRKGSTQVPLLPPWLTGFRGGWFLECDTKVSFHTVGVVYGRGVCTYVILLCMLCILHLVSPLLGPYRE